jgi:hypothetical protein
MPANLNQQPVLQPPVTFFKDLTSKHTNPRPFGEMTLVSHSQSGYNAATLVEKTSFHPHRTVTTRTRGKC